LTVDQGGFAAIGNFAVKALRVVLCIGSFGGNCATQTT